MTFWECLDQVRVRNDVLRHPFYLRWSAGELTLDELAVYAGQYRHAVAALADAAGNAARLAPPDLAPALWEHAAEEAEHIALWDRFADAVGADLDASPVPETEECARKWTGDRRPLLDTLVALYSIESTQPAIAEAKRVGLRAHYGIEDPTAIEYFDVHVERDVEHAATGRVLIEQRVTDVDHEHLLGCADVVLAANWKLLDGVQRASHPD